jgi:anti-sigma regulatory factor (Ser/Thr protein kinase)
MDRSALMALVEIAVLLTSEVVTNAVVHADPDALASELVVRLAVTDDVVRIEVHDDGPGAPTVGDGAADDEFGRGMVLVEHLASAWGVVPDPVGGKSVWFEVRAL